MRVHLADYVLRPKQRPRIGRGGHVYSPSARDEETLAWLIRSQAPGARFDSDVEVRWAYRGKYRGDADNATKLIFDALQKSGVIENDKAIRKYSADLDGDEPGLVVEVMPHYKRTAREMRERGVGLRGIARTLRISFRMARRLVNMG